MLHISVNQESFPQEISTIPSKKLNQYKELIQQLYQANRNYKKKSKKIKNSTIKAPLRTKKSPKLSLTFLQFDQNYGADQSQSFSEKQLQFQKIPQKTNINKQKPINKSQNVALFDTITHEKKVQIKEGQQMQELLKNIGLLKQGNWSKNENYEKSEKSEKGDPSMRSFSDFENQSQGFSLSKYDINLVDDSNNCWGKQEKMFYHMNRRLFGESGSQYEGI